MTKTDLQQQLDEARETIQALQEELAETNSGLVALTLELEQRVDERTAELSAAHAELEQTNAELMQLTLELEDRVAERTSALAQTNATLQAETAEHKRAEEALRVSETRYRRLFEAARDGILILDAETGMIIDVNPFMVEKLGFSHEQFLGKQVWDLGFFKNIIANQETFLELQQQGYVRYEDLPLETAEGRRLDVEFVSNVYLVDHRKVIQCNIRDITDRKRAEMELQAKNEEIATISQQLMQSARLATMGELAASIAHELNNPLATVSLRVESLLAQAPEGDPKRRALEVIEQEVERMANLVAHLLEFSRRSGQQISTVDVREEIDNTLELVHYRFHKHGISIEKDFPTDLPMVHADRSQLRQVFLNLFTNAIDAMQETGGKLTVRAGEGGKGRAGEMESGRMGERENGGVGESQSPARPLSHSPSHIYIEIADTGPGIAPEHLAKVMEPFFTTKPEGQGTGLGLPICRRIVQEHHGTFEIESEVGRGTAMRITLPVANGKNGKMLRDD